MRYQHIVKLVGVIKKDDISLKEVICSEHKTKYINEESDLDIPSKFFNAIYELLQIRLNLMIALLVIHLGSYKRILRYKDGTSSAIKKEAASLQGSFREPKLHKTAWRIEKVFFFISAKSGVCKEMK